MTAFLAELRRRNVIRMAGLYLVGAWLVTQVAGTILPMFGAPEWMARSVVIVLAIGFIPALVIAWAFELTPQGLKRDADVPAAESIAPRTARRMDRSIIVVLVLALLYFGIDKFVLAPQRDPTRSVQATSAGDGAPSSPTVPAKSIAVLPFENLSRDEDNAYFASGMQDMILTKLAGIGDLKVISRTSTEKYKSRPDHLAVIARELGVATILEGSVQKSGKDVLISVQLIDAVSDSHLWADAYPRTLDNIFGVEGEVAQKVAEALHAALTRDEITQLALKPTRNVQALEAYLLALALEKEGTTQDTRVGVQLETAVRLDPEFTLAWTELVWKRLRDYWFGFDVTTANLEAARFALDRAIALSPGRPEVDRARAQYLYYAKRDFAGARRAMDKVLERLPNDARTWLFAGFIDRRAGAWEEASAHFRKAQSLDPRDSTSDYESLNTANARRRFADVLAWTVAFPSAAFDDGLRELKLFAAWNVGGLDAGDRALASIDVHTPGAVAMRAMQALFRRDYATASTLFARAIADAGPSSNAVQSEFFVAGYLPATIGWQLRQALCEQRAGSDRAAAELFADVQAKATEALRARQSNPNVEAAWHAVAAVASAGLGKREEGIAQARRAVELIPESIDAFEGPYWQDYLALVYAMNDDAANALPLIAHLVRTNGSMTTTAMLKLDPVWDAIRDDPGFKRLTLDDDGASPSAGAP